MMRDIDRVSRAIKRAVDSVLDHHIGVARFYVNIRGASLKRVQDDGVDQLDDGRHLFVGRKTVQIEVFLSVFRFTDKRKAVGSKTRRGILQDSSRRISALQGLFDRGFGCDRYPHPQSELSDMELSFKLVDAFQIGRIRHRYE